MGAWGVGHFDNDGASDFTADLADQPNWEMVALQFGTVNGLPLTDYLEGPDCETALAAAAVVAHLSKGYPIDILPKKHATISALGTPSQTLVASARAAVDRVKSKSELRDLWDETGDPSAWLQEIDALERALAA